MKGSERHRLKANEVSYALSTASARLAENKETVTRVAAVVRPDAVITRAEADPRDPDRYHSDGQDWEKRCENWELVSEPLDRQIEITAAGVLSRGEPDSHQN